MEVEADLYIYMDVSKNRGTPKWMVKIMEKPIKMDDLGVPLFSETSISIQPFLSGQFCHLSVVLLAQNFKEMQQKLLDIAHQ